MMILLVVSWSKMYRTFLSRLANEHPWVIFVANMFKPLLCFLRAYIEYTYHIGADSHAMP